MNNIRVFDTITGDAIAALVHGEEDPIVCVPLSPLGGYVTIDGTNVYPCVMGMDSRTGDIQRWNGFVGFPLFDRETAERVVRDVTADNEPHYVEGDRFIWEGDVLLQFSWDCEPSPTPDNDAYGYTRRLIEPTEIWTPGEPRWCIGGYEWTWALATADEVGNAGFDPGLRDL